ncbi:MAG: hypothetical protein MJ081_01605 [Ruminococcus sp.]|nr:hypothetical protein [Ruminococcus sp.]
MKHNKIIIAVLLSAAVSSLYGCGTENAVNETQETTSAVTTADVTENTETDDKIASADEMVTPIDITEEGMTPIYADSFNDGEYDVTVDSSSSMFNITSCKLTVADGKMNAEMTMSGKGYLYVFMGNGETAVNTDESEYIAFAENENGEYTFSVPVDALDKAIDCTAFSKKKEKWYDRTILFRADSLPLTAFKGDVFSTADSLNLEDGEYTAEVSLSGGSGRASVKSPTEIRVSDGIVTAVIEWSSSNYDYMIADDEKYLPINEDGNSVFEIPVSVFDYAFPVKADTTAMSTPHEIEYTLCFDSATLEKK